MKAPFFSRPTRLVLAYLIGLNIFGLVVALT